MGIDILKRRKDMLNNFNLNDVQLLNQINDIDWSKVQGYETNYKTFDKSFSCNNDINFKLFDNFLEFLKTNFELSDNIEELILFLREYSNLINVIYEMPNLFNNEFPNDSLEIKIISRINEEKILVILVHTNIDGFNASKKIEKIEDELYNQYGNIFENIIISAEFFK